MKFIMAQPALKKFEYQVGTAVNNLEMLGVSPNDIILLFTEHDTRIPREMEQKFGVRTFVYPDDREQAALSYIPSIRPYLWWKFLESNPDMQKEEFMYQDADVVYRKIPNLNTLTKLSENHWYGSDTESYTGPDYLNSKGTDFVARLAKFLGITSQDIWNFRGHAVGAQWIIKNPTIDYWKDVYYASFKLYEWVRKIEHEYDYVLVKNGGTQQYWFQIWVSEMIAEAYLCAKYGITTEKNPELNFSWSSDTIDRYAQNNLLHDAGITEDVAKEKHLFFKGERKYDIVSPFDEDLSYVNPNYCSYMYAYWINQAKPRFRQ